MLKFDTQKYFDYQEITEFLKAAVKEYPELIQFESIGLSYEKRKIWLVSLTNQNTGAAENKPSLWIDANTHASEVAGAQSALYFIFKTLTEYKKKEDLKFLLDHMNFYILPQVSPDGAEFYLKNKYEIRSSPKIWDDPATHENMVQEDIDKNGEVLLMRKEDPAGGFKVSKQNDQLLVQRQAFDLPSKSEKYYSLYKEGLFKNFNGFNETQQAVFGLDLNRQFPAQFRPEGEQKGASSHPMSSPEIRSFVDAFVARPRIFGHIALHTYGGLILRPPAVSPEEKFDLGDLNISKTICDEASRVSGYEALSTSNDFKYYSRESESGTADDWSFEHRGVFSFTIEIWDAWKAAGIEVKDHVSRYFKPAEADLVNIYKWAKANFKLKDFYAPWKEFDHPQIGKVEIGGWKTATLIRNPPPELLKDEMQKVNDIILQFAKILPLVQIKKTEIIKLDAKTTKIVIVIENQGFLPTNGSEQAIKMAAIKKPKVHFKTSSKLTLISGRHHHEIKHLQGRNRYIPIHTPVAVYGSKNTHECQFEWLVQGSGYVDITFDFQRGGVLKTKIDV